MEGIVTVSSSESTIALSFLLLLLDCVSQDIENNDMKLAVMHLDLVKQRLKTSPNTSLLTVLLYDILEDLEEKISTWRVHISI